MDARFPLRRWGEMCEKAGCFMPAFSVYDYWQETFRYLCSFHQLQEGFCSCCRSNMLRHDAGQELCIFCAGLSSGNDHLISC